MTADSPRRPDLASESHQDDDLSTKIEIALQHLRVCERFTEAVLAAEGKWDQPSPCDDWNARGLVEHVIGFHDVLLLGPMGAKPERPRDDPVRRWQVTRDSLRELFARPGLLDGPIEVPAVGNNPPTRLDAAPLVRALTQDVLVHTWDLARAVGADDRLDPGLCQRYLDRLPTGSDQVVASGMFAAPVDIPQDADPQTRLLARLGRDPRWGDERIAQP
ncbi:MAG: TIGR03086 family metal-binding protein [Acidimicrobiales bacterium]